MPRLMQERFGWALILAISIAISRVASAQAILEKKLVAHSYNSGFADAHDTYNGMGWGSDGKVYYALSSPRYDVGAQIYSFDPTTSAIRHVGDITEVCGEKGQNTIVQGKVHVNFVEMDKKLYFATHIGYYSIIDGMEKMGVPPEGWTAYPGGHLLSYDLATGEFEDFGVAPGREGILTMNMDTKRGRIYGITWPKGHFFRYDVAAKEWKDLGLFAEQGEDGKGESYRTLCRSIAINPEDGSAYFTISTGDILRYDYMRDEVVGIERDNLRKDYFGQYDPASPGHMGYNWRQTFWRPGDKNIYGVHGNSGYLFRFDPAGSRVEVLDRITSLPSKRSGMFDQFSYGYLGFALGHDGKTVYYLTGGPIYEAGERVRGKETTAMGEAKAVENLHLVTYDIDVLKYTDHGAIFYEHGDRPLYVNSIAVTPNELVCFLARVTEGGKTRTDLVTVAVK